MNKNRSTLSYYYIKELKGIISFLLLIFIFASLLGFRYKYILLQKIIAPLKNILGVDILMVTSFQQIYLSELNIVVFYAGILFFFLSWISLVYLLKNGTFAHVNQKRIFCVFYFMLYFYLLFANFGDLVKIIGRIMEELISPSVKTLIYFYVQYNAVNYFKELFQFILVFLFFLLFCFIYSLYRHSGLYVHYVRTFIFLVIGVTLVLVVPPVFLLHFQLFCLSLLLLESITFWHSFFYCIKQIHR